VFADYCLASALDRPYCGTYDKTAARINGMPIYTLVAGATTYYMYYCYFTAGFVYAWIVSTVVVRKDSPSYVAHADSARIDPEGDWLVDPTLQQPATLEYGPCSSLSSLSSTSTQVLPSSSSTDVGGIGKWSIGGGFVVI